ncbi:fused (3R)-hydroxyacyl-ACP dehydratase subunits HadA/HadB [Nocardia pseudovaccinii]|uniref:fused (3R)-hydroxyacyl-ACP dehydratase subunits HadA/HadB n=1 Tax=Nocardia pseudovaccinii TaxID=189540 RepID=UPI0007A4A10E|nr:fused (3R)-hydroxyacyl-ACP dehydratase subunits HadA/HadB [Nocardia pseudovaccinii]
MEQYRCDDYYEVGREKIREFARAIQDVHPTHWDDTAAATLGYPTLLAPLTFASSVATFAQRAMFREATGGYEPSRLLHIEQEILFHRPILAGDRLTWELTVNSHRAVDGGDLIVVTTVISDRDSGPAQTVHTTLSGRRGNNVTDIIEAAQRVSIQEIAPPIQSPRKVPAPLALPNQPDAVSPHRRELSTGHQFPRRTYRLGRGDLVNYAGVSGDNNPIHWSDTVSRTAGLENVVAHGMLTMGLGAGYLTSQLDDPSCVREYTVRFARTVAVNSRHPTDLEFSGTVQSINQGERTAVIALTAQTGGHDIFSHATAKVRLA